MGKGGGTLGSSATRASSPSGQRTGRGTGAGTSRERGGTRSFSSSSAGSQGKASVLPSLRPRRPSQAKGPGSPSPPR